ncbi:NUMOD4 domain-containing protein, partial [Propionibacterium freudenreichii]|uniref:NUMOD4 domain-containing protein n=1 Tax=Propionibacterium freudenreichii TaxID=1744 RepID=UPI00385256AD
MIKPIKGYETRYWAHSSGRIISLINHNGKKIVVMKGSKVGRYAHVGMHNINGIRKNKNI